MMGFGSFRLSDLAFSLLSDPDYDIFHQFKPAMIPFGGSPMTGREKTTLEKERYRLIYEFQLNKYDE